MNLIQFLALKLYQGPVFIDGTVNATEVVVHSVVVPENIDAVRQLILQDRHRTYREIETTLGISGTSIHLILHEHLTVNKICSRWIIHNLSITRKNQSIRVTKVFRELLRLNCLGL